MLARRVCDALEVTGNGARVRLYVALDSPTALG